MHHNRIKPLTPFFRDAASDGGAPHKVELRSMAPIWKNRLIDKKTNLGDLSKIGFGAAIIGVSTGADDPRSITSLDELDGSIYRAFAGGVGHVYVCNNFAPHQFDTKRKLGLPTSEEAYRVVKGRGDIWRETNSAIIDHYQRAVATSSDYEFDVINWDSIRQDNRYTETLSSLNRLYEKNGSLGDVNFSGVVNAYIRSYFGRYLANKATEEEASAMLKDGISFDTAKRTAILHIDEEKSFLERKRDADNNDLLYGKYLSPSVDILAMVKDRVRNDLLNSAIEKIAGYAIMSDDLAQKIEPDQKIAYFHNGGTLFWDEFFATRPDITEDWELGSGLSKLVFFTTNTKRKTPSFVAVTPDAVATVFDDHTL